MNWDEMHSDAVEIRNRMLDDPSVPMLLVITIDMSGNAVDEDEHNRTLHAPYHEFELLAALTDVLQGTYAGVCLTPRPHRILIVDHEVRDRAMMISSLWTAGYQVEAVRGGEEALRSLKVRSPNLLTMHRWMPGMDGCDVLRSLPTSPELAEMKKIFLTQTAAKKGDLDGLHLGVDCYLTKPFNSLELLNFVRRTLSYSPDPTDQKPFHLS